MILGLGTRNWLITADISDHKNDREGITRKCTLTRSLLCAPNRIKISLIRVRLSAVKPRIIPLRRRAHFLTGSRQQHRKTSIFAKQRLPVLPLKSVVECCLDRQDTVSRHHVQIQMGSMTVRVCAILRRL